MTLINIGRHRIDVDIVEELQNYHWERSKWTEEKLTSCSPFRADKSPSFFVNLQDIGTMEIAGTYKDSATGESGNFIELLAFLQGTDYVSAKEYLLEIYAPRAYEEASKLHEWKDMKKFKPFKLSPQGGSDYLVSRGISYETQALVGVGKHGDTVMFPWKSPKGDIMACKYRRTDSKVFSYEKDGYRVNRLLFGIDYIYSSQATTLYICEAEIDALTVIQNGYASVALGGSSISDRQAEMILQSGVQRIVIASDNDGAGKELAKKIKKKLYSLELYVVRWDQDGDDINAYYLREGKLPPISKSFRYKSIKKLT
ncbi:DNA primase [Bacillus phage PSYJ-YH]|nr:DNA primase [Bacillus phage PSYJ-YH]